MLIASLLAAAPVEEPSREFLELSYWQIAIAASLILINGLISVALRLGLERRLLVAAVRTVVQLSLLGLILNWIFALDRWYLVAAWGLLMTSIAGVSAVGRVRRRHPGVLFDAIVAMWAGSWIVLAVALAAIVRPTPWYDPQYAIPLLGMLLGNTLNGVSLGLDRFGETLVNKRAEVETLLALGATRWEAARGPVREAIQTGMIPIVNSMAVVGLVSLPGMMTGQLLAGADPMQAVLYQIVIMFLIAAGTALGTVAVVLASYRRLFTPEHRFLYERLTKS